jgi:hypothetical protein
VSTNGSVESSGRSLSAVKDDGIVLPPPYNRAGIYISETREVAIAAGHTFTKVGRGMWKLEE